jgi:hypothetical protein
MKKEITLIVILAMLVFIVFYYMPTKKDEYVSRYSAIQESASSDDTLMETYKNKNPYFSIKTPEKWTVDSTGSLNDVNNPLLIFFEDPSDKWNGDDFVFSISAVPRNIQNESYKSVYGVYPNQDEFTGFFINKEINTRGWTSVEKTPVTLNGLSGYSIKANIIKNGGSLVKYMLFDEYNTYYFGIDGRTEIINSIYNLYKPYMLTFSTK